MKNVTTLQIWDPSSLTCLHASQHLLTVVPRRTKPRLALHDPGTWAVLPTLSSQPVSRNVIFPRLDLMVRLDMAEGLWHATCGPSHPMLSHHSPAKVAPDGSCIVVNNEAHSCMYQVDLSGKASHRSHRMGSMPTRPDLRHFVPFQSCSFEYFPGGWSAVYAFCQRSSGKGLHRRAAAAEPQLAEVKDIVVVDAKVHRVTSAWTYHELLERAGVFCESNSLIALLRPLLKLFGKGQRL